MLNLKLSQYHRVINSTPENELFPVNMKHILEVKTLTPAAADQSPTPDQGEERQGEERQGEERCRWTLKIPLNTLDKEMLLNSGGTKIQM